MATWAGKESEEQISAAASMISKSIVDLSENYSRLSETLPAPYKSLPSSYKNLQPTSYYATHTHVQPIKDYFAQAKNIKSDEPRLTSPTPLTTFSTTTTTTTTTTATPVQQDLRKTEEQFLETEETTQSPISPRPEKLRDSRFESDQLEIESLIETSRDEDFKPEHLRSVEKKTFDQHNIRVQGDNPVFSSLSSRPPSQTSITFDDPLPEEFNPIPDARRPSWIHLSTFPNVPLSRPNNLDLHQASTPLPDIFAGESAEPENSPSFHETLFEPAPEFDSEFLPSHYVPQFAQESVSSFLQQPLFYPPAPIISTKSNFGVSVTPIVVNKDGFKEDNLSEMSPRNDKSISGLFKGDQPANPEISNLQQEVTKQNLVVQNVTQHFSQIPKQNVGIVVKDRPLNPPLAPPDNSLLTPAVTYINQWTTTGHKKPLVDPSIEAAKYWQRLKEQQQPPKNFTAPVNNSAVLQKDQQAVESLDDFSEFDSHHFSSYPTFPTDHPMAFEEDDHSGGSQYGSHHSTSYNPSVSYIPSHPVSYVPDQTVTYYESDEDGPEKNALLYLSPKGPKMPVFSKLMGDMSYMMSTFSENFREPLLAMRELAVSSGEPMFERMGNTMGKIMGGHFGDGTFDAFDFIPLVAIIVATSLVLGSLFPNGLASLGLSNTGGTIIIGRKETRREGKTSMLDEAIDNLEAGIMMISAMRRDDGCDARLACQLGGLARDSEMFAKEDNRKMILGAINQLLPETFSRFSRSFEGVVSETDLSSCEKACYRCVTI